MIKAKEATKISRRVKEDNLSTQGSPSPAVLDKLHWTINKAAHRGSNQCTFFVEDGASTATKLVLLLQSGGYDVASWLVGRSFKLRISWK